MEKKDQLPAGGCVKCGKYAGKTQGELRKRLKQYGDNWLCSSCWKLESMAMIVETEVISPEEMAALPEDMQKLLKKGQRVIDKLGRLIVKINKMRSKGLFPGNPGDPINIG